MTCLFYSNENDQLVEVHDFDPEWAYYSNGVEGRRRVFEFDDLYLIDIYGTHIPQKRLIKIMPFGKHKGKEIKDIPHEYLEWLSKIELRGPLHFWVREEMESIPMRAPYTSYGSYEDEDRRYDSYQEDDWMSGYDHSDFGDR